VLKKSLSIITLKERKKQILTAKIIPVFFALLPLLFSNQLIANNELNSVQFNPDLQKELLSLQQESIALHQEKLSYPNGKLPKKLIEDITKLTHKNSERLLIIIKHHGWPSIDKVGIKGRDAAFVLVQQAEAELQTRLIPTLKNEFNQGQLSGQKLATLIDNNLIKQGKKQRYGTQLAIVNGQIVFNEIEDESQVEQRRAKMKMMPMIQYKKLLKKMYQLD
jgi:hypothetical protein